MGEKLQKLQSVTTRWPCNICREKRKNIKKCIGKKCIAQTTGKKQQGLVPLHLLSILLKAAAAKYAFSKALDHNKIKHCKTFLSFSHLITLSHKILLLSFFLYQTVMIETSWPGLCAGVVRSCIWLRSAGTFVGRSTFQPRVGAARSWKRCVVGKRTLCFFPPIKSSKRVVFLEILLSEFTATQERPTWTWWWTSRELSQVGDNIFFFFNWICKDGFRQGTSTIFDFSKSKTTVVSQPCCTSLLIICLR